MFSLEDWHINQLNKVYVFTAAKTNKCGQYERTLENIFSMY